MKNEILACLALSSLATIAGCATQNTPASGSTGWDAYKAFKQELIENSDAPDYQRHLASDWRVMLNNAENAEQRKEIIDFATYPQWLVEANAHYEKSDTEGLCLSVNGVAYDGNPGTVAIRYVTEHEHLKAAEIHYQYWETKQEFPPEAQCPEDFELDFPGA